MITQTVTLSTKTIIIMIIIIINSSSIIIFRILFLLFLPLSRNCKWVG